MKIYGFFKEKDGTIFGYIENSFDMAWDISRVRVFENHEDAKHFFKLHLKECLMEVGAKYFIARLNSKKSGMRIRWNSKSEKKFEYRNACFELIYK